MSSIQAAICKAANTNRTLFTFSCGFFRCHHTQACNAWKTAGHKNKIKIKMVANASTDRFINTSKDYFDLILRVKQFEAYYRDFLPLVDHIGFNPFQHQCARKKKPKAK